MLLCKSFNVSFGKYFFINETKSNSLRYRILMFNIMLLVNKAVGCVDNMFSFVTTGRHIVLCFQRLVQHLDQTLEKVVNTLRNIFYPFLKIFVERFQRFYNGMNNITNALKTIINALQCIVNAFKMHCECIQNALQRCFR